MTYSNTHVKAVDAQQEKLLKEQENACMALYAFKQNGDDKLPIFNETLKSEFIFYFATHPLTKQAYTAANFKERYQSFPFIARYKTI